MRGVERVVVVELWIGLDVAAAVVFLLDVCEAIGVQ